MDDLSPATALLGAASLFLFLVVGAISGGRGRRKRPARLAS